jgi:tRNA (cytidine32/uridine32-2'-O)-methyltransferase
MLSKVRIVLVNTSHPGNIGAVARAMKNMCLEQLVLVSPQHYPHAEATARASGADDLLARAQVVETLDDALQGCSLVLGASARMRRLSWPQLTARECANKIADEQGEQDIAILFGREHSGLTNEELARCHYLVYIPSNPDYTSLNIAAAVQVICYELLTTALDRAGDTTMMPAPKASEPAGEKEFAGADEMEGFFRHLEQVLTEIEFLSPDHPGKMLRRLRRLFNRARLTRVELNIMRGILTAIQQRIST